MKDTEIANLNFRLTSLTPGRAELEGRLHELTESLIQKQTTLETLSSERSTLNVQLQRLQVMAISGTRMNGGRMEEVY